MRVIDIINLCRQSLSKQKARTRLTVLGVVVGCCAIVLMMSLGIGSSEQTKVMLSQMGDLRVIDVYNFGNGRNDNPLNKEALKRIEAVPNVEMVSPKLRMNISVRIEGGLKGRYQMNYGSFMGFSEEAFEQLGYKMKEGDYLVDTGKGVGKKAIPVLVGEKFFYEFIDTKRPEGKNRRFYEDPKKYAGGMDFYMEDVFSKPGQQEQEVQPYEEPFFSGLNTKLTLVVHQSEEGQEVKEFKQELVVVGILKADIAKDYSTLQGLFMSVEDMESIIKAATPKQKQKDLKNNYEQVVVKAKDIKNVKEIEQKIKDMGYEVSSMESIRESINKSTRQQQMMLAGLGGISLFVAAIGIMNTMIMSITERTKEIGIMKALGCYVNDIRKIFLVEAGVIGFIGGVIGIIVSQLISLAINVAGILGLVGNSMGGFYMEESGLSFWEKLASIQIDFHQIYQGLITPGGRTSIIPPWLMLFGLVFSTLVGLVSGYNPANKAVKIPALEAIKHE